ncbi:MAG: TonB family protein [Silvibacterium sp.]
MATAPIRSDWVGRVVDGRFTLLQWLGSSGRSDVFLTELQGPRPRKATIKLIPADAGDAHARIAGWAATKDLSDPHLMRLFHAGRCQIDTSVLLYAVMEYAEEVLAEIIPERPLTPGEAEEMLGPILDALSYLHGKGFVHGHLKPSNILDVDNQVKLSGDSLQVAGKPVRHAATLTVYDAPEVADGTISPAADIWSLGVTLVETLTQRPPVWERSANREPVVPGSIPQPFADIAQECLRLDPARRCALSEVKARLGPVLAAPNPAGKTDSLKPATEIGKGPTRLRVPAFIAAALVLFAVIAFLYLRSHQTRPSPPTATQQAAPEPVPEPAAPPPQSPVPKTQTSNGLPVKGAVAQRVQPNVPQTASMTIRGTVAVRIRLAVDPGGNVSSATFDSPGPSKYFANLAMQAARNWKFKPPQANGQAVSSTWILRFQFRPTTSEITPVETTP